MRFDCVVLCLFAQLCQTVCYSMDCSLPGAFVLGDSPGKNTGVGCHALLQGIFPTQGSNRRLRHHRWILYHLSHQGSPTISQRLLRFMSMELVMLSNHLILCHPLFLLPPTFASIRVFSSESALCLGWHKKRHRSVKQNRQPEINPYLSE